MTDLEKFLAEATPGPCDVDLHSDGREMTRTQSHFTFGQSHMTNYPLPRGGRIADYWVTVDLPESMAGEHRDVFIREFTSHHCPRPNQFAMEYDTARLQPDYFPGGQLCLITEDGIQA